MVADDLALLDQQRDFGEAGFEPAVESEAGARRAGP